MAIRENKGHLINEDVSLGDDEECKALGESCWLDKTCCSNHCVGWFGFTGIDGECECKEDTESCTDAAQCCSGNCAFQYSTSSTGFCFSDAREDAG